jgi:pyridoxal 5'-phosphate synthase pdxT subunit
VAVRQGNVVAISFHPELSGERRLHELMLGLVAGRAAPGPESVHDVASG